MVRNPFRFFLDKDHNPEPIALGNECSDLEAELVTLSAAGIEGLNLRFPMCSHMKALAVQQELWI